MNPTNGQIFRRRGLGPKARPVSPADRACRADGID